MKKSILLLITLLTMASSAFAECPVYKPYGCHPVGGKMQCGCGQ